MVYNNEMNLESIAQNCENIELEFSPYGLYHIILPPQMVDNKYEVSLTHMFIYYYLIKLVYILFVKIR